MLLHLVSLGHPSLARKSHRPLTLSLSEPLEIQPSVLTRDVGVVLVVETHKGRLRHAHWSLRASPGSDLE